MRSAIIFIKRHGYELFVTLLVLALGAAAHHLRQTRRAAASASAVPPASTAVPATALPTSTPEPGWLRPVSGGILTAYSDELPCWNADMDCWQIHAAVDLAADEAAPVRAAAAGTVQSIEDDPLLGLTVTLSHKDGWQTKYASLSAAACRAGQTVRVGDIIGAAGNSADSEAQLNTHLHFELLHNDLPVKPSFLP